MRRVCESVSSLINPCRRWQFPSVKYQSTVYKSLTKNYYYCTKSFTADSLSSQKRVFSPRKKDIKRRQKNPFSSLFPSVPTTLFLLSLPKKAISRKSRDEKRRIKMHPYHLVAPSFFQTFFFPLRETALVAWSESATKS